MTDPQRLIEGELSAVERALLNSAASDAPSASQLEGAALALGLSPPLTGPWALLGGSSGAKIGAAVATLALVGAGMLHQTTASEPRAHSVVTVPGVVDPAESPPASTSAVVEIVEAPPAPPRPSERSGAKATRSGSLAAQVALIDEARSLLGAGDAKSALSSISRYRVTYPTGAFRQEAFLLELEALAASGQKTRAIALGRSFLERYPNSPHAERVGRVLGQAGRKSAP